jgi:hypothetical protein
VKVVVLLLRLYEYSQSGSCGNKNLASLLLGAEMLQNDHLKHLWMILNKISGHNVKDFMICALHPLLALLLCPQTLLDNTPCPTKVLLFLTALTESGYHTAASVAEMCCKLLFNFCIIYLHMVRLDAKKVDKFELFKKPAISTGEN